MPRFHQRYDATLSMVWSSLNLEERFKTHKSSIWTVKIGFGVLESHLSAKIESLFWWAFLSELFWSLALIEVNSWSDWVAILGARLGRIDLHSNSGDWIWSLEKWYFSPRTLTKVKETLTYVIVTKIWSLVKIETTLTYVNVKVDLNFSWYWHRWHI